MPLGPVEQADERRPESSAKGASWRARLRWLGRGDAPFATLLGIVYLVIYFGHPAVPRGGTDRSWWDWFDQIRYLNGACALGRLDLDPDAHHYPFGYPLLGAPFCAVSSDHAFLPADLAAFVVAGVLLRALARRFVGPWESTAIVLAIGVLTRIELVKSFVPDWERRGVGVARADLFPTVTLGGSIGSTALELGDLGSSPSIRFNVGPLMTWSFPNMLAAQARLERARAGRDGALARFDQVVLLALQETETALSAYANELDRRATLLGARNESAEAARLARRRFQEGVDSFLSELDAERRLAEAEARLAESEAAVANSQIAVFKALGGGWAPEAAEQPDKVT